MPANTFAERVEAFKDAAFEFNECAASAPAEVFERVADKFDKARAALLAYGAQVERDAERLNWLEAQFVDHNRDCNLVFNRFQYGEELSMDAENASWSRMTIRECIDAALLDATRPTEARDDEATTA